MKLPESSVSEIGVTTIPIKVRESLGMPHGARMRWEVQADGTLLVRVIHRYMRPSDASTNKARRSPMGSIKNFNINVAGKSVELTAFLMGEKQLDAGITFPGSPENVFYMIQGPTVVQAVTDPTFQPGEAHLDLLIEEAQRDARLAAEVRRVLKV